MFPFLCITDYRNIAAEARNQASSLLVLKCCSTSSKDTRPVGHIQRAVIAIYNANHPLQGIPASLNTSPAYKQR
jgi:hypothetical protein